MLKLYGATPSRSAIVQWYLEELALPYEFVSLDLQAGEQLKPEYLAIHPFGKVPAIEDGEVKVWESGAILLYLAEKYDRLDSLEKRTEAAQWVLLSNSTLANALFMETFRERDLDRVLKVLDSRLSDREFLVGDSFSVADVAVGSMLGYGQMMIKLDYSAYPSVIAYCQRLAQRPAFVKAIGSRN